MRLATAFLLAVLAGTAQAQQAPFDMSPEKEPGTEAAEPAPPVQPAPPAETPVPAADLRRLLLPAGNFSLSGENTAQRWALYLTSAQAASAARINLAYQNSVVVAPEDSSLQVLLNDTVVVETPIRSAEGFADIAADVPASLLRAGRNEITLRARQRHRTDCTVQSTYDLWTEIDSGRSFLSFSEQGAASFAGVEDLRSIAADAMGEARIVIVAPGIANGEVGAEVLRLAQALALYVALPDMRFEIVPALPAEVDDAALRVLVGSADELAALGRVLPAGAGQGPVAAFVAPPEDDATPTLVVSGRHRDDWVAAIGQILAPVDRPAGTTREALLTETWRAPNAPMIYAGRELSFAELGVRSERFSGRRFATSFQFGVPADFYAGAYGEARILLDAAFSDAVLPGSRINVYVNGSIAASMPIAARNGGVLEQLPVKVTMRHFRPGLNEVTIEANLLTEQDEACLPGATADDTPRFAIFGTSRFVIPQFGRIGQLPNLAGLAGTGYPFVTSPDPVSIVAERGDTAVLSVAADLFARVALSAGRAIPVTFTNSADAARGGNAVFLGAINGIPAGVLAQVGIAEESRVAWTSSPGGGAGGGGPGQADAEAWREEMEGRGWMRDVEDWFSRTFDITLDMLRFAPAADPVFTPSLPATLLVAQGINPEGTGAWTVVTAPDAAMLAKGLGEMTSLRDWGRLSGRLTTLDGDGITVNAVPAASPSLIETQPGGFANYRLIVANWLSANILSYSLLIAVACMLLGIATSALLSRLGRRG